MDKLNSTRISSAESQVHDAWANDRKWLVKYGVTELETIWLAPYRKKTCADPWNGVVPFLVQLTSKHVLRLYLILSAAERREFLVNALAPAWDETGSCEWCGD
jgi:hypothetical protein